MRSSVFQQPGMDRRQSNAFVFEPTAHQLAPSPGASSVANARVDTITPFARSTIFQSEIQGQLHCADVGDEDFGDDFQG